MTALHDFIERRIFYLWIISDAASLRYFTIGYIIIPTNNQKYLNVLDCFVPLKKSNEINEVVYSNNNIRIEISSEKRPLLPIR